MTQEGEIKLENYRYPVFLRIHKHVVILYKLHTCCVLRRSQYYLFNFLIIVQLKVNNLFVRQPL